MRILERKLQIVGEIANSTDVQKRVLETAGITILHKNYSKERETQSSTKLTLSLSIHRRRRYSSDKKKCRTMISSGVTYPLCVCVCNRRALNKNQTGERYEVIM